VKPKIEPAGSRDLSKFSPTLLMPRLLSELGWQFSSSFVFNTALALVFQKQSEGDRLIAAYRYEMPVHCNIA
jgi:hypothetical protein